jgi:hypothetical protein
MEPRRSNEAADDDDDDVDGVVAREGSKGET